MKTFTVTRDAILTSTLNHLVAICMGNEIEETRAYKGMTIALEALRPKSVETEEGKYTAHLVVILSKVINNMELESDMLELLRPVTDEALFDALALSDYSMHRKDEQYLYIMGKLLLPVMIKAGLQDLETSFAELDSLMTEAVGEV